MKIGYPLFILGCFLSFSQCKSEQAIPQKNDTTTTKTDTFFTLSYSVNDLAASNAFDFAQKFGMVQDSMLNEISGMAESYKNPGNLWVEEDSGNDNVVYLIDKSGNKAGAFRLKNYPDLDWEDLAVGPGPTANVKYIYLAEIGDNSEIIPTKYIYRFPEPDITGKKIPVSEEITAVDKISFQYPDGIHNAETVMVDPATKDIYVISKGVTAGIYLAAYPQDLTRVITLKKIGVLPISLAVAGDISPDGNEILIKDYSLVYYWKKSGNESITHLLQKVPVRVPYTPEPQGEAICWASDGSGYYTCSENGNSAHSYLYFYKRK